MHVCVLSMCDVYCVSSLCVVCTVCPLYVWCVLGVKQYGSMPYCVLCLSVLQYIAILQYLIGI